MAKEVSDQMVLTKAETRNRAHQSKLIMESLANSEYFASSKQAKKALKKRNKATNTDIDYSELNAEQMAELMSEDDVGAGGGGGGGGGGSVDGGGSDGSGGKGGSGTVVLKF